MNSRTKLSFSLHAAIFLFIPLVSCENEKRGDEINGLVTFLTPSDLGPKEPLPYDSVIEEINFVPLETSDFNLISEITKIRILENQIYILDRQQRILFIYSTEGRFITKIESGEGPSNPNDIIDFTLDDSDNIVVLGNRSLFKFSKTGKFLEQIEIDFNYDFIEYAHPIFIAHLRGEYFIWTGSIGKKYLKERPDYAMYKLDRNYRITEKYFVIKRQIAETWRFQEFKDSVFIIPTYLGDTVFKATNESVTAKFFVNFQDRAISQHSETKNSLSSESTIAYELGSTTDLCMGIRNFLVTPNHIYFQYRCGNFGYHYFYNKNTGGQRGGRFDFEESPMFNPLGVIEDKIVFYTEAARVVQELNKLKIPGATAPHFIQNKIMQLESVKIDDNPVLSLVKLRNFK